MTSILARIIPKHTGIVTLALPLVILLMAIYTVFIHFTKRPDTIQAKTQRLMVCMRGTHMDKNGFYGQTPLRTARSAVALISTSSAARMRREGLPLWTPFANTIPAASGYLRCNSFGHLGYINVVWDTTTCR